MRAKVKKKSFKLKILRSFIIYNSHSSKSAYKVLVSLAIAYSISIWSLFVGPIYSFGYTSFETCFKSS